MSFNSVWLDLNSLKMNKIISSCEEYYMKGSYGGSLDLLSIKNLLLGSKVEIEKLVKKINEMQNKMDVGIKYKTNLCSGLEPNVD